MQRGEFQLPPPTMKRVAKMAKSILRSQARHARWVGALWIAEFAGLAISTMRATTQARFRCYALAGSVEYEMAQCEPSDSTAVCGEVMRALCEGPEGEPRWAADVRLGDSVRIVRKTAQE